MRDDESKRILIVEDQKAHQTILRTYIESYPTHRCLIDVASSCHEALAMLKEQDYDLVFLDLGLPDSDPLDILDTLKKIRAHHDSCSIIVVTAKEDERLAMQAISLGAEDYVLKNRLDAYVTHKTMSCAFIHKQTHLELIRTKSELEIQTWGLTKTNEGIKTLYKELENKNKELQRLDKLKTDFVSTVSHELRTPMAIIKEGIALVNDGTLGEISEDQKKYLNMATNNIERLARIINDLLDISKIESGKLELKNALVNIRVLIEEVAAFIQPSLHEKGLRLYTDFCADHLEVYADRDKLMQVFVNLLGNAIKFTKEGHIKISVNDEGPHWAFHIQDTGCGIAERDLPRVFGKFQQFSRVDGPGEKGTGLGLAICQGIVHLHEGKIYVDSQLGHGTTFTFTLPKKDATRATFNQKLLEVLAVAKKEDHYVTLLVLDFLNYNHIRQLFSDDVARETMQSIVRTISDIITRREDIVFQYKEHQIFVVLPDTNKAEGTLVSHRIRENISQKDFSFQDEKLHPEFRIGMSLYPDDAVDQSNMIHKAIQSLHRDKIVLIVDDHEEVVVLLQRRMEEEGYKTLCAASGVEALRIAEKQLPDLIILDVMMPEMNGYEVFGRLKKNSRTAHIPIVMLTAQDVHAVNEGRFKSVGLGSVPILQKSEGFEHLVDIVQEFI